MGAELNDKAPELYHILGSVDIVRRNGRKRGEKEGGKEAERNKEAKACSSSYYS